LFADNGPPPFYSFHLQYLPKLRGSSGFSRLFHTYLRIHQEWHQHGAAQNKNKPRAYLVDPDSLRFNLDFCIAFFGRLAATAPRWLLYNNVNENRTTTTTTTTTTTASSTSTNTAAQEGGRGDESSSLSRLHNYVAAGYLPQPFTFEVLRNGDARVVVNSSDEYIDDEEEDNTNFDEDDDFDQDESKDVDTVLVRLLLGEAGSEDFYSYELWHPKDESIREARRKLADMALSDLIGANDNDNNGRNNELVGDEADLDGDDMSESDPFLSPGMANYDWELRQAVEGKVDKYLYGILWNLQTYQDGLCPNYGFSYGKRMSPMASEIVDFFQAARDKNHVVGPQELKALVKTNQAADSNSNGTGGFCGPSIAAGLSCLAALPSAVKNELVPEPYCWIPDETVEDIYSSCMSPIDNTFDMTKFAQLCEEQVEALRNMGLRSSKPQVQESHGDRRIIVNEHSWTVISKASKPLIHPFDPPRPFSENLSRLRPNSRIRISHSVTTMKPRPRSIWNDQMTPVPATTSTKSTNASHKSFVDKEAHEIIHSDPGTFMSKYEIDQVPYKIAYQQERREKGRQQRNVIMTFRTNNNPPTTVSKSKDDNNKTAAASVRNGQSIPPQPAAATTKNGQSVPPRPPKEDMGLDRLARMKAFRLKPPPLQPSMTSDGITALSCLKQLQDAGLIGNVEWKTDTPSMSKYASFDPESHESNTLIVRRLQGPAQQPQGQQQQQQQQRVADMIWEQDRCINVESRKIVQQHLASLALCDIISEDWSKQSFRDLKQTMENRDASTK
jgi:hypothetical protein